MLVAPVEELRPEGLVLIEQSAALDKVPAGDQIICLREHGGAVAQRRRGTAGQRVVCQLCLPDSRHNQPGHAQSPAGLKVEEAQVGQQVERPIGQAHLVLVVMVNRRGAAEEVAREGDARRLQACRPGEKRPRQSADVIVGVEPLQPQGQHREQRGRTLLLLQRGHIDRVGVVQGRLL